MPMNNMRWLFRYIYAVKWAFLIGLGLQAIKTGANLSFTGIQKYVIDDVFVKGEYDRLAGLMGILSAAIIIYNVFHAVAGRIIDSITFRIQRLMSHDVMKSIHHTSTEHIVNERTAQYVNYVTSDVRETALTASSISNMVQQVVSILILGLVVGFSSPLILASILAVSGAYVGLGIYFRDALKRTTREVKEKRADLLVHIEEGISSSREVIAYDRTTWERQLYDKLFDRLYRSVMAEGKLANKQMLYSDPLKWLTNLLVLGIGGYGVMQEHISLGTFVVVYQFASQLMEAFYNLFSSSMNLVGRMAVIERIRKVMEGPKQAEGNVHLAGPIQSLEFDNVSFQYGSTLDPVLNNLSMNLPLGNKIAFVGTSGGGKSTLSQLLIRFYEPSSGEIRVNGIPLGSIQNDGWEKRIAIVFQDPYLFPDTIRSNLLLGREDSTEEELRKACEAAHIYDFISQLKDGFDTQVGERGIVLSGGQRQRIALARVLLMDSEILILDEATSALDLETERIVQHNIDELRKGRTTLMIAHRLSTVKNADVLFVMDHGKVVEVGTHDELMQGNSLYKQLVVAERMTQAI